MDNTNEIETLVLRLKDELLKDFNPKFDDLSSKIQDLDESINEALEALNERRYIGEAKEYFEE